MKNRIKKFTYFESLLLFQFLFNLICFLRDQPRIVFVDLIITLILSIAYLIFIILQKIHIIKKIILIAFPIVFFFILFYNVERIYFGKYYRILFENRHEFANWEKLKSPQCLINIKDLNRISTKDSVVFFSFYERHPIYEGIAYSKYSEKPAGTGLCCQSVIDWGRIYGNWYYWSAYDVY